MQSGCRANKRFGIIDGENLSASSVMVRQNFATSEKLFFGKRRAQQILGVDDRPRDLAKEWNVVCDAYSQSQISSSWQPIWFAGWVEYGLKQSKNELGWADFRMMPRLSDGGR